MISKLQKYSRGAGAGDLSNGSGRTGLDLGRIIINRFQICGQNIGKPPPAFAVRGIISINPGDFADPVISYPQMSSTCMLLFRVLCRLELFNLIDKDTASCLLAGMMTDTGNFAYNANDPDAYIIEAELVKKGADKVDLYNRLLNTVSENCLRLTSYAMLEKMEIFNDFHAALICLTRDELNRFHYVKGDTEGLVNRPLAVPGIVYSAFLREEDGYVKVSMRSLGDFPVNKLCNEHFGGGGHLNAAGGEFAGTLEECAELFRSLLPENKRKYIDKNTTSE